MAQLHVAVLGAGPAGIYAAELISHSLPGTRVDIIDHRVAPVGLNAATTTCPQTMRFIGNLQIGTDLSLDELRDLYDAVVYPAADPTKGFSGPYPTPNELIADARAGRILANHPLPLETLTQRGLPITLWHGQANPAEQLSVRLPAEWQARIERAAGAPVCI